jgi:hypothetical protein
LVCLTSDLKLSNQGEDSVRRAAGERHHSPFQIAAEMALYFLRFMLEPRVDLSAVAARRAPARLSRFQNSYIGATLSKVQRRRQPSKATAHHDDAGAFVAAKRRGRDRVPCGFGVKARRQLVSFRFGMVGHDCPIARFDRSKAVRLLTSAARRWDYRPTRKLAQAPRWDCSGFG